MPLLASYFPHVLVLRLRGLKLDRRAVTAIEYALIAALIAVVVVTAVTHVGNGAATMFGKVAGEL